MALWEEKFSKIKGLRPDQYLEMARFINNLTVSYPPRPKAY